MVQQNSSSLPDIINAWGTPTPYGVSRSSAAVGQAVSRALECHVDMTALQSRIEAQVIGIAGTQAACFCHCSSAGITLAVAGALGRGDPASVLELPRENETGVIAIQREHCVDYGQPITQAVRLAGAKVIVLDGSTEERLQSLHSLAQRNTLRAILFVDSSLVTAQAPLSRDELFDFSGNAAVAFIVDAAAQDWRLNDRDALARADITIFSAQKYLAAPTCGILVGNSKRIRAAASHLHGLGRAMKPTKEALYGVAAALAQRDWTSLGELRLSNIARAEEFSRRFALKSPTRCTVEQGASQGPFPRILLHYSNGAQAMHVADLLYQRDEPIVVGRKQLACGILSLELSHVNDAEENRLLTTLHWAEKEADLR